MWRYWTRLLEHCCIITSRCLAMTSRSSKLCGWSSVLALALTMSTSRLPGNLVSWVLLLSLLTLTLPSCGADACARQTPSAEATARAQCTSPTDLKVDRTSLKLWQTSGGEANGCLSLSVSNERVECPRISFQRSVHLCYHSWAELVFDAPLLHQSAVLKRCYSADQIFCIICICLSLKWLLTACQWTIVVCAVSYIMIAF